VADTRLFTRSDIVFIEHLRD